MRTNKLVWIGVAMLLALVVVVAINATNKPEIPPAGTGAPGTLPGAPNAVVSPVTASVPKKVNVTEVSGDTISESMKNLQANYELSEKEKTALKAENKALAERVARVETRVGADAKGDDRINVVADVVNDMKGSFTDLAGQFSTLQKNQSTTQANGYEFSAEDLGIDDKGASGKKAESSSMTTLLPGYVSVKPLSMSSDSWIANGKNAVDSAMSNAEHLGLAPRGSVEQNGKNIVLKDGKKKSVTTPFFTIPARATLMDATAMTAMIGRVPVGGRVQDPVAVKFVLGDDNLATNGLMIPGLKGIVFEGIATGDWNLSCVSVQLTGATFTFQDGRIQHLPNTDKTEYEGRAAGQLDNPGFGGDKNKGSSGDPIGYISSPQGVPCIGGTRFTDAPKQLATVSVLGLAQSYYDAKAQAETTQTFSPLTGSTSGTVTGDKTKFVIGDAKAGAAQAASDFYKSRNRDSLDAIVVNPGAAVALHITQDLYIDYNTGSRKLAYSQGGTHVSSQMD